MSALYGAPPSEWPAYVDPASDPALIELEASAMSDLIYLAIGGGAFIAFAALAAALKRV